ncbi:MAG: PQQ-dependent sugar dehydrogenase [Microbacteriaceae bacterium]|nr:PQQ-dependent sugar dehydrogenase [Microbacteriaceae bacterium]
MTNKWTAAGAAVVVMLLAGCSGEQGEPAPIPSPPTSAAPQPTPSATPDPPVQPVGTPTVIVQGFTSPWSVVRLASGSSLVSERDTALVKEVTTGGDVRVVGEVLGVRPGGEGGLLGLAVADDEPGWLYAYFTSGSDNRIERFRLDGAPGGYTLGGGEEVLVGLRKAGNHNGGRIAFGPDGMLYATVGDAGNSASSQDPASLNGKILRMTRTGAAPGDNPTAGSLVYSLGHRNPQGITWDAGGQLWAAEFGQNTWDEFNAILPGANYGWPVVEGIGTDAAFQNPVYQWSTREASPSGLTFTRGTFFMAALRGEQLWAIYPSAATTAVGSYAGELGRIRDVTPGPGGTLWMLTSNTDGRGDIRPGDDKLVQVQLETRPAS